MSLCHGSSLLGILLLLSSASSALCEGKLDSFEKDVNTPREHVSSSDNDYSDGFLSSLFGDLCSTIFEYTLLYGGACSIMRVSSTESHDDVAPRALGEPLIPFARLDLTCHDVESDITATDLRAEGGCGPLGVQFEFTRYTERKPADDLDLIRVLGSYRMSFGSHVETDLAFGMLTISGKHTNSRGLFSLPILIHPEEYWGFEFRPAWADNFKEYDAALLLTWKAASLKTGYRWVNSPNESLDGPYIGISVRL